MKSVSQTTEKREKKKFDIGQVHEAVLKLRQAGLTPGGLQRLVLDKELARKVVVILEEKQETLERLDRELKTRKEAGKDTSSLFNVSCDSVTLEQLQSSNVPEKYLYSLWVSLRDRAGNKFTVVHVNKSHILLSGESKDIKAFERVRWEVTKLVKGVAMGDVSDRGSDICQVINLLFFWRTFTPKKIVSDVQGSYMKKFTDVRIGPIFFLNVPFKIQVAANIPLKNEAF